MGIFLVNLRKNKLKEYCLSYFVFVLNSSFIADRENMIKGHYFIYMS